MNQPLKANAAAWGDDKLAPGQAADFAREVTRAPAEQEIVARSLATFPSEIRVRGLFFEGLSRVVGQLQGATAMDTLMQRAGLAGKVTAFRSYPHRDFYRLYYLTAALLHPSASLPDGLRLTARTFFPIFQNSLVGRTMTALMGDQPSTLLPLLARAYNISVEGNEHRAELRGPREIGWSCTVEPVEWYASTFAGIVEGAMPQGCAAQLTVEDRAATGGRARYRFRITW
jgi:uncharacterized protein (TIGR02265 family)